LGLTAPKTYQSHFWHVKEEYVWPLRVARCRRDMAGRQEAAGRRQGCRRGLLGLLKGRRCDWVKDELGVGVCETEYLPFPDGLANKILRRPPLADSSE